MHTASGFLHEDGQTFILREKVEVFDVRTAKSGTLGRHDPPTSRREKERERERRESGRTDAWSARFLYKHIPDGGVSQNAAK